MFKLSRHFIQIIPILLLFLLFNTSVIQTQDETPTETSEIESTATELVSTEIPPEIATDMPTEVATEIPTEEPTEVITEIPTETSAPVETVAETDAPPVIATVTETAPEATSEMPIDTTIESISGTEPTVEVPTPVATELVVPTVVDSSPAIPDEPAMQLLIREMFNNGDLSAWLVPAGWSLMPSDGGQAIQVTNSTDALILQKGLFFNVAVQARFLINSGNAQLHVQRGETGTFSASLDSSGLVTLYHDDLVLQTSTIELDATELWHELRLSVVDGVVRVAVDSSEVIAEINNEAISAGGIMISAASANEDDATENDLLVDDFFLWVPQTEAGRYSSPTPMAVVVVSTPLPTALPTEEVLVDLVETANIAAMDVLIPLALPNAPILKAPADGIVTAKTQEKFTWFTSKNTSYLVDLDDNSDFSSPVYEDSPATKQFVPPTSLAQGTYFWRVQAQNNEGVSSESEVRSFTVNILTSPTDGSALFMKGSATSSSVSFKWSKVTGATNYMLYLYEDLTCSSLLSGFPVDMGTSTSAKQILEKGQYCWKVQAVGVDGGIPPVLRTFIVSPPAPAAPNLVSPANKGATKDTTPSLDWDEVTDAFQYRVEWSSDKGFKSDLQSMVVNAPTTEFTLATLPDTAATTYYWRVGSMNDLGVVGRVSKSFIFTLDTEAPDAPSLKSLADGSISSSPLPKLSWQSSSGASSYLVDIDDNSNFSSPLYENNPASNQFVAPSSLPQGTYFWRVQAQDAAGNVSGESDEWSFTVNILTSPTDGSSIFMKGSATTGSASFKWSKVTGATNYMLYLYEDLTCTSLLSGFPVDMGSSTSAKQVLEKGQYCWKVQAVGVDGGIPPVLRTFIVSPPAPAAPNLVSPANKGATKDRTPSLDWDEVTDAFQYRVEWSSDKGFKSDLQSMVVNAPTTEFTLATLPDTAATTYYWRVGSMNDLGVVGKVSKPFTFTLDTEAPDAPSLKSLADGSISSSPLPKLNWQSSSGASSYLVDIDDNSDFSSPLYENSPASTQFVPPISLPQGTYFWRVQAQDAAGNVSGESDEWSFTVNILTSPTDGSALFMKGSATTGSVSFKWSKVTGATNYMLYLYEDLSCTSLLSGFPVDMGGSTSAKQVLEKGQYCWKVQAVGVDGGIPPVLRTFIVSPPAPAAPSLLSPANKGLTNDRTPTLDWNEVTDAFQYRVEWSSDKGFKSDVQSTVVNAPTTEFTLATLPDTAATTYYWRVGSMNDLGVVGKVGKPFTFTLDTAPPAAPNLISPADGSTTTSSLPKFTWSKVSDAAQYEISLDTVDPPLVTDSAASNQYTPPSPLLLTTYYWQVRAVDEAGNVSEWSNSGDAWEVNIESTNLAPPVLNRFAPENPAPMDLPPTLCWSPISWAEGYELQVDNHSNFSSPIYVNDTIGDDAQCVTIDPLYDGTWHWRVRAIRSDDDTNWSPAGTFTVES